MSSESGLNEHQKTAVLHKDGPLLIIAGAGAGKTKTITHRILHLIQNGVAPSEILAITFTNKAAREMRERVEALLTHDPVLNRPVSFTEHPFVSTFHALGVHIIKENSALLNLPRHFAIFDRTDSKRLVKEALEEAGFDPKQYDPAKILGAISREKGDAVSVEEYAARANDYFPKIVSRIWEKYERKLGEEKALDFDDLLVKTLLLFRRFPEVLEKYQNIWKYIHIDEYQDTNKVQYSIVRALAMKHRNLCVVGDSDQMIYSWRGADIQNILDFEKDYPDATVVVLEENYRSTKTILAAANLAIGKNKVRRDKNLFTVNGVGEKIGVFGGYDEADEADFIAEKSRILIQSGVPAEEIAVLYRANFQSRVIEESFLTENIPYQVLGTRFFERSEVKDLLSYIKAALNQENFTDIKRAINTPARGIGKVTVLKVLAGAKDTLPKATLKKVNDFYDLLIKIKEYAENNSPSETLKFVMSASGIEQSFKMSKSDEDAERLENIRELVTLAKKYDGLPALEGMEHLLADAALASDQDSLEKKEKAVKLMTVHAAKGLEFDYVFITGLEENLFPHKRDGQESDSETEEERRLFYVALTRARKKLFLTYAGIRTIFGNKQVNIPSEFMIEMDDTLIQAEERMGKRRTGIKTIYFD